MKKHQFDSAIASIKKSKEIAKAFKGEKPVGALDHYTFKGLPDKTLFWMVWELGPESWITPAETRKIHTKDSRNDHLGKSFVIDWNKQFPYTNKMEDKHKYEIYRRFATEYYGSYNLSANADENYNDSYTFLDENKALEYLEYCRKQPRFKTPVEEENHKRMMKELQDLSDDMEYTYVNDPRWDD